MPDRIDGFDKFWREYLANHRGIWNRRLHCFSTFSVITLAFLSLYLVNPLPILLIPAFGWIPTLAAHIGAKNGLRWWSSPLLSVRANIRLLRMSFDGTIEEELRTHIEDEPAL